MCKYSPRCRSDYRPNYQGNYLFEYFPNYQSKYLFKYLYNSQSKYYYKVAHVHMRSLRIPQFLVN